MASKLKVDEFEGVTTAGSIDVTGEGGSTTTNLQQGLLKAWLNLNQGIASIQDSFNISSVSDSGTGRGTHNFSNNFNDNKYVVINGAGGYSDFIQNYTSRNTALPNTTSSVQLLNSNYNFTQVDTGQMNSAEAGDLA